MATDEVDGFELKTYPERRGWKMVRSLVVPLKARLSDDARPSVPFVTLQQASRDGREDLVRQWLIQLSKSQLEKVLDATDAEGFTAMHYAARFNRFKILQLLYNYGADPAIESDEGKLTPLHFAARYIPPYIDEDTVQQEARTAPDFLDVTHLSSSRRTVSFLVQCNVDVNCQDKYGISPLHIACMRNNLAAVEVLLQCPSIDVWIRDNKKSTPLHEASINGNQSIVDKLLAWMGRADKFELNAANDEKQTALHLACREGYLEIVKLILQYGFNYRKTLVQAMDNEGSTPLHLACESGSEEIVQTLLLNGADIHCTKDEEVTPLHLAAECGFTKIAEQLLASEVDIVDVIDVRQQTPLHYAAEHNKVDMVNFLIDKGADMEALDEESYSPLLMAAFYGHTATFQTLQERGAKVDIVEKDGKSVLFLTAANNHLETLKAIISNPTGAKLCQATDSQHNTPLHIAAAKGNADIVDVLLRAGVQIDARNELGKTPIHLASEKGHIPVLRQLIAHRRDVIADEDENGNSPLHLACINGYFGVAKVLLDRGADAEARNAVLWTPMDCAAAGGWDQIVSLLIQAETEVNPVDRSKVTPLHLAAGEGHLKVVNILLDNGARVANLDENGFNALDLAIENGHEDVAMAIVKGPMWVEALRNVTKTERGETTPLRKLIRKMPDVAEYVFNLCTVTNATKDGTISPDSDNYCVTYNYEFLEDFRDPPSTCEKYFRRSTPVYSEVESKLEEQTPWGLQGFQKSNHPLSIMVESARTDLLKHPLVTSLLKHKWNKYGRWFYAINLFSYALYLAFLTAFAVLIYSPLEEPCLLALNASVNTSLVNCTVSGQTASKRNFLYVAAIIVILLALVRLSVEAFQMVQLRLSYWFSWINWLELLLFTMSIVFVWVFHTECLCPYRWQWQIGAIVIFLAWIELIVFIQKLPLTGIYVVMFLDIFYTFCRLIALSLLLVVAFGLAFYMCFYDPNFQRTPFTTPALSMVKTITMANGEYEFDGFFRLVSGGNPDEDQRDDIAFPPISYLLWIIFIILMPILLTNLLVGLAVDDIKGILKSAVLKRLALRVELVLNVEELFPTQLRRLFIIEKLEVMPNHVLGPWGYFLYQVWGGERFDSSENIASALNPALDPIEQLQYQNRMLMGDVDQMKQSIFKLEAIIKEMAKKQGITPEEL